MEHRDERPAEVKSSRDLFSVASRSVEGDEEAGGEAGEPKVLMRTLFKWS
jgi:hypothetical protein